MNHSYSLLYNKRERVAFGGLWSSPASGALSLVLLLLTVLLFGLLTLPSAAYAVSSDGTSDTAASVTATAVTGDEGAKLKVPPTSFEAYEAQRASKKGRKKKGPPAPVLEAKDYPEVEGISPRVTVWLAAQMHLWFAAFVLAVPIFVLILEAIGMLTGDRRYDRTAYEFIRVSITAYSITAITGGLLLLSLIVFYPAVMGYMSSVFSSSMLGYGLLFFVESITLYIYYYGWGVMNDGGGLKRLHLLIGLLLNISGTALMFIANAWVTFMMSPAGVDKFGALKGGVFAAINNHLWHPMNLHRFVANIAYGGSIVGAYAAYKYLSSRTEASRAHYDWMGYTASFIAIGALLPIPFAGYWLTAEIYSYSQQMGITLMGGVFGWLFIVQAVLIGALFLAANYYLWCGMGRTEGGARYTRYIKYIAVVLVLSFLVWFTPHNLVLTATETSALGGQYHPWLKSLGLMPAKNTAVNIMVIFTYISFLLYRRAGKASTAPWAKQATAVEVGLFGAAIANILFLGVYYGYYTDNVYKVVSSVPQVLTTLVVIVGSLIIEWAIFRRSNTVGGFKWGRMPDRSQYALVLIAVSFTWLMGLMGFVRSAIRQNWHVYSIMKDASAEAYTPSIAYAARVVSVGTIIFMALIIFIFWLSSLGKRDEIEG
ncbi:MAG: cytochrome ubiquinol oxidase subunit I [Proteobacteria bacterium]|nr:cytochrome ubiquinol oxidase subunit I [Pseudomonadota bacterium]